MATSSRAEATPPDDRRPIIRDTAPHQYRLHPPKPTPRPQKRAAPSAAQAQRHRALIADGYTVKLGANGVTVFDFGGASWTR
jgi:hypothetical protein